MALITLTERTPAHRAYKYFFWALLIGALIYAPYFAAKPARIDQFTQVLCYAIAIMRVTLLRRASVVRPRVARAEGRPPSTSVAAIRRCSVPT